MQLSHFVEVIRGQSDLSCSCEEGLRALIVCDAVKRSLESSQPIDIDTNLNTEK